jgi:hypothetical protein
MNPLPIEAPGTPEDKVGRSNFNLDFYQKRLSGVFFLITKRLEGASW